MTLVNGRTFTVARTDGSLAGPGDGTLFEDLRMLSTFRLVFSDAHQPIQIQRLGVSTPTPFEAVSVFRPHPGGLPAEGEPTELYVHRQWVGRGTRHDIEIQNNGASPITRRLTVLVATDFAHLFDVKAGRDHGPPALLAVSPENGLHLRHHDDTQDLVVRIDADPSPNEMESPAGALEWEIECGPRASVTVSLAFEPIWDGKRAGLLFPLGPRPKPALPAREPNRWDERRPHVRSTDARVSTTFDQALVDLASLRIFDPSNPTNTVIAAGAPWFMTLFGRDSLLSAWMALPFVPDLARGVLRALAELQGQTDDPVTEEAPGKILHELRRHGGDDAFAQRGRYYGTVDATPLFVMLAAEAHRWGALDDDALADLAPAITAATEWTRRAMAAHAHGFVAYERSTETGLLNQGWKDSWDGVTFADGRLPSGPVALVEVQGYAYAALLAAADLAEHGPAGVPLDPVELRREATDLRERFNRAFWDEPASSYSIAVVADGTRVDSVTTNPGHALWCGIADDELANRYLDRTIGGDLWNGWGLRTLSPASAAYNPLSYHNGSVWPHDTALVAAGAARVRRYDAVDAVVDASLDAAACFDGRPPELFAGVHRSEIPAPVSYPSSCSPQAWSSASVLLNLRSLVGLEAPLSQANEPTIARSDNTTVRLTLSSVRVGDARYHVRADDHGPSVRPAPT